MAGSGIMNPILLGTRAFQNIGRATTGLILIARSNLLRVRAGGHCFSKVESYNLTGIIDEILQ
jgi:hypothetical protein